MINILMQTPVAVMRSDTLADRMTLQQRETGHRNPLFAEACAHFNDYSFNSRGLIAAHEVFTTLNINPEERNVSGSLSVERFFSMWKSTLKNYSETLRKFEQSGKHNGHDFWLYCQDNSDILYLHLWLNKLNNPELTAFCSESHIINVGFDSTSAPSPSSAGGSSSNSSRSNKRKQTEQIGDILKTLKTSKDDDSSQSRMNETIRDAEKELLISNTIKRMRGLLKTIKDSTDNDEVSMLTPELERLKKKYAQLIAPEISQQDSFTTPGSDKSNSR